MPCVCCTWSCQLDKVHAVSQQIKQQSLTDAIMGAKGDQQECEGEQLCTICQLEPLSCFTADVSNCCCSHRQDNSCSTDSSVISTLGSSMVVMLFSHADEVLLGNSSSSSNSSACTHHRLWCSTPGSPVCTQHSLSTPQLLYQALSQSQPVLPCR